MKILHALTPSPHTAETHALTVGNFDGVHLGHQAVLKKLKDTHCPTVVFTFDNHPVEVLKPGTKIPLLCTVDHKLKLMEEAGIAEVILLSFTKEFSQQSPEEFLQKIKECRPFSFLILGPDAAMGKDRSGDKKKLETLAKQWGFHLEYLPETTVKGVKVSSSKVRECIQQGDLAAAKQMLGRDYSIYMQARAGQGLGKKIGFPTINFYVEDLCLPPFGVYAVTVKMGSNSYKGVANLGIAPTVRHDNVPILEVHLIDFTGSIEDHTFMEVIFADYLRPEMKFPSIDALKAQIAADIGQVRSRDEQRTKQG